MKILTIESSSKRFSLAISDGAKILKSRSVILRKVLSSSIIPAVRDILKATQLTLKDLDAFVVGLGPGSFTSLRVGLSTVKGLAMPNQTPIIGIVSLDALAQQAGLIRSRPSQICVIVDARRNLVYGALYRVTQNGCQRKSDYFLLPITEILAKIKEDTLFIGDAIGLYQKDIQDFFRKSTNTLATTFAPEKSWFPEAKYFLPLTLERISLKQFDSIDKLIPLYLYPDHCQVQK